MEEHHIHVRKVLQWLEKAGLYLKSEKCEFHVQQNNYLGLIISVDSISMDTAKGLTVQEWSAPKSVKKVQLFLGFANFFRSFIKKYSKVVSLLAASTKRSSGQTP